MALLTRALRASCFAVLIAAIAAHSFLTNPPPDTAKSCRTEECSGACNSDGKIMQDGSYAPVVTYERGQMVVMAYARNNHANSGFVRYTLVPKEMAMDKQAHEDRAFHFSCWGANTEQASAAEMKEDEEEYNLSGSDEDGKYFTSTVKIPTSIPDGDYVLGWTWYGGLDWDGFPEDPHSVMGDYASCALVTISGGPLTSSYSPVWVNDVDPSERYYGEEGCLSSVSELGVCEEEPCRTLGGEHRAPKEFDGQTPTDITPDMYGADATVSTTTTEVTASDETSAVAEDTTSVSETTSVEEDSTAPAEEETVSAEEEDTSTAADEDTSTAADEDTIAADEEEDEPLDEGVSDGDKDPGCVQGLMSETYHPNGDDICCPKSCGECGGDSCGSRDGGDDCCHGTIMDLKRDCNDYPAPCMVHN